MSANPQGVAAGDHKSFGTHLTYKGNRKDTRFGWLRLTPAYSLDLVSELIEGVRPGGRVLDPYCGTGTTSIVAGALGVPAITTDINPFLIWLTHTKAANYSDADLVEFDMRSAEVLAAIDAHKHVPEWLPPIHQIEKWWDGATLHGLGRAMAAISKSDTGSRADDLLRVVFCRSLIERAAVSFGHQSMSFKKKKEQEQLFPGEDLLDMLRENWIESAGSIRAAAQALDVKVTPEAVLLDARDLTEGIEKDSIARVITSPPYPNRMSYIRELRPYLYWLGYLQDAKEAGELDWKAIGGTWGIATSRAGQWTPPDERVIAHEPFLGILDQIASNANNRNGVLLSRYIHKYFYDTSAHVDSLFAVMERGATAHYIVGNSKFYDVMLPVEEIYAEQFRHAGFVDVKHRAFRKRSSKKELFEFVVEARKP